MTSIDSARSATTKEIINNLKSQSDVEKRAESIGNRLHSIEERYMKALTDPNAKDGEAAALEVKYRRAMRAYESFQRLMQNSHEMMMRAIQALAVR